MKLKAFSRLSRYLIFTGGGLLCLCLWVKSKAIDFQQHSRYVDCLRQIQAVDARINQNVLLAKDGLLTYYDPIVNELTTLRKLQTELKQPPTFIDKAGREELSQLLQSHIQVWQQKEQLIQRFGSQNAILRNSMAYLPIAIASLTEQKKTNPSEAARLTRLLHNILLFNTSTDEQRIGQIKREIQKIIAANTPSKRRDEINAIAHARIILNSRPQVDNLIRTMMALPVSERSEALVRAYDRHYEQALKTTNAYRLWLYLLSAVLLMGVAASIILKLRASAVALRYSEAKFRNIFENSQVGIFQVRVEDGLILDANQRLLAMFGYDSPGDLIGLKRTTDLYLDPSDSEALLQRADRPKTLELLRTEGQIHNFETQFRRRDGSVFWGLFSARFSAEEGCIDGVVADISDRKHAEEALRSSEATNRALISAIPDLLLRVRGDGTYLDILGSGKFNLLNIKQLANGKTVYDPLPPDRAQERLHYIQQALRTGEVQIYEHQLVNDGELRDEEVRIVAIRNNEVLVMVRDITDRKRAEQALQRSERKFRHIFENSQVGIFRVRAEDGLLLDANQRLITMMGYEKAADLLGLNDADKFYVDPSQEQSVQEILRTHGEIQNVEAQFRKCDGTLIWGLLSAHLDVDEGYIQGVITDISDRKQAEAALQQAVEAAETANRAKSIFLANMSHELRTPLNVILGFSQLMIRNSSLNPQHQEYLNSINRSGEHLLTLINDVLEMSKIEAGRITLNETDFDLYDLLNWLQEMFRLKAQSKGLLLTVERANDLPEYIRTDESKLRQVLVNLLGNAVKFTTAGRVMLRVGLGNSEYPPGISGNEDWGTANTLRGLGAIGTGEEARSTPYSLLFEVEDTGSGIAPTELERLFQPFVQTQTGQNSQEGTGLGLAISQEFVQLMGGEITVSSAVGSGTVFRFNIQAHAVETGVRRDLARSRQIVGLEDGQPNYRILVVEDKPENRQILIDLFTAVGFEVREAINGSEAIALWESWSPHLIWMDIRMPVMDGYEATKQIQAASRTAGRQSPIIIALTGSVFEEDRKIALSIGCVDFVRKPFRADELFEKMARYLGVRYVYAAGQGKWEDTQMQNNMTSDSRTGQRQGVALTSVPELPPSLTASELSAMPTDWVEQLHQAATKVNAKLVLKLIEQIPESNTPLADTLTHLVNNFCFEEIVELTQQQVH